MINPPNRTEDGPEQGGNSQVIERGYQFVLPHAPHNHNPSDRHHHGAADTLHEAHGNKKEQGMREPAQHGTDHEHRNGAAEDYPAPETVRHPSGDRNEYRQADQVGGQAQFEQDGIFMKVRRDHRQRGADDGGIHQLHEERAGDDHRHQTGAPKIAQ